MTTINRQTIQAYNQFTHAVGVVGFLRSVQNDYPSFRHFLLNHQKIRIPNETSILFHGSFADFDKLIPPSHDRGQGVETSVYATSFPEYAIFMAVLKLEDLGHASVAPTKSGLSLSVDRDFVNGSSKLDSGFVNVVSQRHFHPVNEFELESHHPVEVLFSVPVDSFDLNARIVIDLTTRKEDVEELGVEG